MKFKHLSLKHGLCHSKVNCIYQDKTGFLWIGTNEGLNKFNGYEFTTYQRDPDNPYGISANLIRCVYEDSKGNLWIGTEAGGLNLYDRNMDRFYHYNSDSSSEIVLSDSDVNSIIEDGQGNLWLGTGSGLDMFDLETKKAINYLPYPSDTTPRILNEVSVIFEDSQHHLWVGTFGGGLCLLDRPKRAFTHYRHNPGDVDSISDNDIRCIYEDLQGNLWIGTYNGGLNLFDRKKQIFYAYYPEKDVKEGCTVRAVWDDSRRNLWVGTRNGLYHFDKTTHQFFRYAHDPNNPYSLSQNNILCITGDAKGDLWIGTRDGINFLNLNNTPFVHYRGDAQNRRCLNNRVVFSILEDYQGDLWFGTEEGGLNHLNRETGLFFYYTHDPNNPNSLSSNNVKVITEDRDGNLWIGTYQGGLNFFDRRSRRFRHYKHNPDDSTSLSSDDVLSVLIDRDGNIWVGTSRDGLNILDRKSQQFLRMNQVENLRIQAEINSLFQDSEGKIWIGDGEGNIRCYDKTTGEVKRHQLKIKLSGVEVRSIFEDGSGNLWFCTAGGGLHFYDRKQESFKIYTKKNGLPSNIIYGFLQDNQGNFWLSTTNGISKFNPQTGFVQNYYEENGLQSNQFCYNAYYKTRDGEMLFGGINGVTAFYPDSIRDNTYIPPVLITELKVLNKRVEVGGEDGILSEHISETQQITLSYSQSAFTFEFRALNFAISEQNEYAYIMQGFDDAWNYVGTRRYATYTNLDPGDYIFRVKAANNDGLWNEEGTAIKIVITPPYWKTWWFKILIVLFLAFIIVHIIQDQKRKQNVLKATALANQAQLKLLRYQLNPHFLFNAHNSIRSMIRIDKERAWRMITELSEFLRYTLLNFNKIEASLDEEIDAINNYLNIERIRYRDSLEVSFKIDRSARKCVVPSLIIQPLIENAIKYGMQTSPMPLQIKVLILHNQGLLSIDVSNSGRLIEPLPRNHQPHDVHGTALENIQKRLKIVFNNQYTFQLFEEAGWVHAKIRIHYDRIKSATQADVLLEA